MPRKVPSSQTRQRFGWGARAAVLTGLTVPIAGGTVSPVRLFFSLPLPDHARACIGEALERAPGFTWSRPGLLHFTLAFLGQQPSAAAALAVTAPGKLPAFELAIGGAGAFPTQRGPRVLWLGVTAGGAQLIALADALRAELRAAGFTLDEPGKIGRCEPQRGRGA